MANTLDTTRLAISGVRSRVALRVSRRQDQRVTVEQKLPFLAIGTQIADERGQTGRIERVGVSFEGGVPKLVLELAYDVLPVLASSTVAVGAHPSTPPSARVRRDETVSYERPTVPEPLGPARPLRLESADRSLAASRMPAAAQSLAFPLEVRRPPHRTGPFAWFTRLFTR